MVRRFAGAYAAEDLEAVMRVLVPDVEFVFESAATGTVTRRGRSAVRAEFGRQFSLSDGYSLTPRDTDAASGQTVVSGSYTQTAGGVPISGRVDFTVAQRQDRMVITAIRSRATP